jgi:DNA modification methylase
MIDVGEVGMVSLDQIVVEDRARKEYGDLTELENSLKKRGLIQPLAVKKVGNKFSLLAGERRFLVLERNKVPQIPVRIYDRDLTEFEMKSIELAENFFRKNFEYWESDALIAKIDELQKQVHGVKPPGPSDQGWGMQDTANLMGITKAAVSTAVRRHSTRENFPELFEKCKTQKDASKVIKKMDETITKEVIAEKLKNTCNNNFNQIAKCYVVRDCFKGIKEAPDGLFHMVEIDPPYAIDLNKVKKKDGESQYGNDDYNEISPEDYKTFMPNLFKECYRVMSDHSWLICWFGPDPWFEDIYLWLKGAGFETTRLCGIWTKHIGQSMNPNTRLANSYEMFFYAWKGRPALNKPGKINQFDYAPVPAQQKTHPTERPIELMKDIYDTFAFPGSRILIPFAGSGSGILAAHQLGMSPIGFDLTKNYKDSFLIKAHKMCGGN